jgi:hypothetical protein
MLVCIVPFFSTMAFGSRCAGADSMACTPCSVFRRPYAPSHALRGLIPRREAGQAVAEEAR